VRLIRNCIQFQKSKRPIRQPQGLLKEIEVPEIPHQFVAIDHAGPLPVTDRGNKYIIVYIDMLTKHVTAKATNDQTAKITATFLMEDYVTKFGPPSKIFADRGTNFFVQNSVNSRLWE